MFADESSYVSFPRSSIFCIHFVVYFENEMSDLSLRIFVSLSFPLSHSLMMWLHFMLDLSGSSLLFVFFASPSFSFLLLIHPFHLTPCHFLTTTHSWVWHFFCIIITQLIISLIFFTALLLLSYSHWSPLSPGLTRFSVHVAFHTWGHGFFIIRYLGLVSLHFYHPITLAYVTSRVFRPPWGHVIRCRLRQPSFGQVLEIWLMFRYHHASSSRRCLFDIQTRSICGFKLRGSHIWWWMIACHLISDPPYIWCHTRAYFDFGWEL